MAVSPPDNKEGPAVFETRGYALNRAELQQAYIKDRMKTFLDGKR